VSEKVPGWPDRITYGELSDIRYGKAPMTIESKRLEELLAKATPGPWLTQDERDGNWAVWTRQPHTGTLALAFDEDMNGVFPSQSNAELIALAPDLARLVLSLRADKAKMLEAVAPLLARWKGFKDSDGNQQESYYRLAKGAWAEWEALTAIKATMEQR
jgi:hypothetical protein